MNGNLDDKDSYSNWKSLPTEVLHYTFQQETKTQLDDLTHVCKAWMKTVQAILYSDIKITSLSQLNKFNNTVKEHPYLGSFVKKLELYLQLDYFGEPGYTIAREEVLSQLPDLLSYLPNLREYKEDSLRTFEPILLALMNFQLTHLKRLNPPHIGIDGTEIPMYVLCATMMKNRLENIALSHYMDHKSSFAALHKDLASYDKLVDVEVEVEFFKKDNEILELEHIVETCKSLESIKYSFYPRSTATPGASIDTISTYTPNPKIKTLTSSTTLVREQTILLYIMHKFPKLQNFTLKLELNNPIEIDHNILARLLDYIKNLKCFSIGGIKVDQNTLTALIANYWEKISKPGFETVKIFDVDFNHSDELTMVDFEKTKDATNNVTTLSFPELSADEDYLDFIKTNGKFIGELQFGFPMMKFFRSSLSLVPEDFISDTFTYCPNLRNLRIEQCALEKDSFAQMDLSKSRSLDELCIKNCSVYAGMLEQCSLMLPELNRLRLYGIKFFAIDDLPLEFRGYPAVNHPIEIAMPNTTINTIILEDIEPNEPVYTKVFVMSQKEYYYYQIEADEDLQVKVSNKEEYNAENDDRHFYICCHGKPELQFQRIESLMQE